MFGIINLKSILDIQDYQKNLDFSLIYKKIFIDFIYLSDRFIGIWSIIFTLIKINITFQHLLDLFYVNLKRLPLNFIYYIQSINLPMILNKIIYLINFYHYLLVNQLFNQYPRI